MTDRGAFAKAEDRGNADALAYGKPPRSSWRFGYFRRKLMANQFGPDWKIGSHAFFGAAYAENLSFVEAPHSAGDEQEQTTSAVHVSTIDKCFQCAEFSG